MPHHSVYGLRLSANLPVPGLPELPPAPGSDLEVHFGRFPPHWAQMRESLQRLWYVSSYSDEHGDPVLTVWTSNDRGAFRLVYSDGVEFVVSGDGRHIWSVWPDALSLEYAAGYLLGPALGFALRLRGEVCLHASAVAVGEQALLLVGPSGAGKSTAAALFAQRGFPVLSDDIVALTEDGSALLAHPGYPYLRLWPDVVKALFGSEDALPCLQPNWDKNRLDLLRESYRFQRGPLPVAAIYLLRERSSDPAAPLIEDMPGGSALMALVANTYAANLLGREARSLEFSRLAGWLGRVPVRQVTAHTDASLMPRLCDTILDDCLSVCGARAVGA